jgi:uncharacterized metal-binding protein
MRFGIPLLANRVAPRCTFADSVLLVTAKGRRMQDQEVVPLEGTTWIDLAALLTEHRVDTLICGGISPTTRDSIRGKQVSVIDNVAGTVDDVLAALRERGRIQSGFGLGRDDDLASGGIDEGDPEPEPSASMTRPDVEGEKGSFRPQDCLECLDRVCLAGEPCPHLTLTNSNGPDQASLKILEAAWDVALEKERTLCRLAELVYFALELGCRRLGVAFCEDLREPAYILVGVLRRFLDVVPVGCRVGSHPDRSGACNPSSAAAVLNSRKTDLNVLVGFCVGADSVFSRESNAPVTTIFVKDKSLANNPIGAVYSHYHLEDI